jgi:hypothetical protein
MTFPDQDGRLLLPKRTNTRTRQPAVVASGIDHARIVEEARQPGVLQGKSPRTQVATDQHLALPLSPLIFLARWSYISKLVGIRGRERSQSHGEIMETEVLFQYTYEYSTSFFPRENGGVACLLCRIRFSSTGTKVNKNGGYV